MVASENSPPETAAVSVMIVDSRPFFSAGLRRLLSGHETVEVVADIADTRAVPAALAATPPDVLLLSYGLANDLDAFLRGLRTIVPAMAVILFGIPHDSDIAIPALRLGVKGLIDDDADLSDLVAAVHAVAGGQAIISPRLASKLAATDAAPFIGGSVGDAAPPRLTSREVEVLRLVAGGLSNRSIATTMGLSEHTVRAHLREVMRKLNVRSRIEAVSVAIRQDLIPPIH